MLPVTPGTHGPLDEVSGTALNGAVHCLPVSLSPCLLRTESPARQSPDGPAPPPQGGDEPPCPCCFLCLLDKALHLHLVSYYLMHEFINAFNKFSMHACRDYKAVPLLKQMRTVHSACTQTDKACWEVIASRVVK